MVLHRPDFLVELKFGNVGFWVKGKPDYLEKTSRSKGENQQQTQLTCGVDTKIWTWVTLVGGECFHCCTTFATLISLGKVLNYVWTLKKKQISDRCDPNSHGIRAFWGNMWQGEANFCKLCLLYFLKIGPVS